MVVGCGGGSWRCDEGGGQGERRWQQQRWDGVAVVWQAALAATATPIVVMGVLVRRGGGMGMWGLGQRQLELRDGNGVEEMSCYSFNPMIVD